MNHSSEQSEPLLLPRQRPEITIEATGEPIFEVDWRELAWWSAVPEVGDHVHWGLYDPPDWRLTYCYDLTAVRPALVHGFEGVEIAGSVRGMAEDKSAESWSLFARVTEERVQCLAILSIREGRRRIYTLLDEGFEEDWGEHPRHVRHTGRFVRQPDGSYQQRTEDLRPGDTVEAMEVCRVTIGDRSFTCLRVLDVGHASTEKDILMEGFLTREGRTVLDRRYNGRQWNRGQGSPYADRPPWDEQFPTHNRIVIDGVTFVHWYDCLTDRAVR